MIEQISLREAAVLLKFRDARSVERFCRINNVPIFIDEGSKRKYIIRSQFEHARVKKFIQYLKLQHKSEWRAAFKAYMDLNITNVAELEEKEIGILQLRESNYTPTGHHEILFLNSLTKNSPEL